MKIKEGRIIFKILAGILVFLALLGIGLHISALISDSMFGVWCFYDLGLVQTVVSLILLIMAIILIAIESENTPVKSLQAINITTITLSLILSIVATILISIGALYDPLWAVHVNDRIRLARFFIITGYAFLLVAEIYLVYTWFKLESRKIGFYYIAVFFITLYPISELFFLSFNDFWVEFSIQMSFIPMGLLALTGILFMVFPLKSKSKKKKNEEEVRL